MITVGSRFNIMHWLSGLIPVEPQAAAEEPGSPRRPVPTHREGP